uniref:NYN domain-containing protein n=1 Tax=Burkholderia arboris TaxID=488730 RepID=UPI003BEF0253
MDDATPLEYLTPAIAVPRPARAPAGSRHVFIDNSNVFGGARRIILSLDPDVPANAFRLEYLSLFSLLEGAGPVGTRMFAGAAASNLRRIAEAAGYEADLLHPIRDSMGKLHEQGVDEILHLKIANALLDYATPQTLVLATGDGGESPFHTSFVAQIDRALTRGWTVELWSWRKPLSSRLARQAHMSGGLMTIHELDPYFLSLTSVRAGRYRVHGKSLELKGRSAAPLPGIVAGAAPVVSASCESAQVCTA